MDELIGWINGGIIKELLKEAGDEILLEKEGIKDSVDTVNGSDEDMVELEAY